MIVTARDQRLRLVTQNDHAHFAAELLSLWRRDGMEEHPRRQELLQAVREHDGGWRGIDSAPMVHAETGRPHDFLDMPQAARREIWTLCTSDFSDKPYAHLLILEHALNLHREASDDGVWPALLAHWRTERTKLLDDGILGVEELGDDYKFLDLTDLASLMACDVWRGPIERHGYRLERTDAGLSIDPFPLAGTTTFEIACRWIPDRRYSSDSDLALELATARWEKIVLRVLPVEEL